MIAVTPAKFQCKKGFGKSDDKTIIAYWNSSKGTVLLKIYDPKMSFSQWQHMCQKTATFLFIG